MITILAVLAYLPAFKLSFIADDFPQIQMSRTLDQPGGFHNLYEQPIAHWRMTFFVLTFWVDRLAGLDPQIYHGVAVVLHVLCCWLVYALAIWRPVGKKIALIAACFFAVYEGHQEAVMWYSAVMETLLFLFGMGAFLCFLEWVQGKGWIYYGMALASFFLALFSKESAYIYPVLMILVLTTQALPKQRKAILGWLPFAAMAVTCVAWIAIGRMSNPRFNDGSFVVTWHFFRVLGESLGRMLFVWGLLALIGLAAFRARESLHLAIYALVWMVLGLVPYSFLAYMNRVPSRLTYLASVGLSLLVAAAMVIVWDRLGGRLVLLLAAMIFMVNVGILWRKKADQYRVRALPTDILVNAVRHADGPIHIRCFPYIPLVAESAAEEFGGMVVYEPAQKNDGRCLDFWYKDAIGSVREVYLPPARLP